MTQQELKEKGEVIKGILKAVADTIKGQNGTPSGIVYAALMQYGCTLQQYQGIIDAFKETGLVKEKNHLLYWVD